MTTDANNLHANNNNSNKVSSSKISSSTKIKTASTSNYNNNHNNSINTTASSSSKTLPERWFRRYKYFCLLGLIIILVQVFLAYLLPIFGTTNDEIFISNNRKLPLLKHQHDPFNTNNNNNNNKNIKDRKLENYLIDNEVDDVINSNAYAKPKQQHQQQEQSKDRLTNSNNNNNNNNNQQPQQQLKQQTHDNNKSINIKLNLNELEFEPVCDVTTKEAISAVHRASTQSCKQLIINVTCAIQSNTFYKSSLSNRCPHNGYTANHPRGCYKDEKKYRILSGYYTNFKTQNTPKKCIEMCLQSGFIYAGVQYGSECFCGDIEPTVTSKLDDSECNYKCTGDLKQICGGYFTINIYETGIAKFVPQVAELIPKIDQTPVKIVYLLTLNGRAVRQVHRLLRMLYSKEHYFYIHVDSRQRYMYRELLALEAKADNIRLARKRFSTIWGGASLLKMLLQSMSDLLTIENDSNAHQGARDARGDAINSHHQRKQNKWQWDYVINLSESDFPVKSTTKLVEFLTANRGKNFVKSHGREVQRFIQKQGLDKTFLECDTHMWRIGDRQLPVGIQIDGGSDWIALSNDFVKYLIQRINNVAGDSDSDADADDDDQLINGLLQIFNHTLLPAESFFHTVLRNTEYCDTYIDNNLHVTNWKRRLGCKCQYKHVVDWCGCSPNDFKPSDLPRLFATDKKQIFFARKFESVINQNILLKLEQWIRGGGDDDAGGNGADNPNEYPNLNRYWQNLYHYMDDDDLDDLDDRKSLKNNENLLVTIGKSLIRNQFLQSPMQLPNELQMIGQAKKQIQEITLYFENDDYRGFLIKFNMLNNRIVFEMYVRTQQLAQTTRSTPIGNRIRRVYISTDYDQKEQISRNFPKIIDDSSEPILIIHLLNTVAASDPDGNGKTHNVTILWINPIGILCDVTDLTLDDPAEIAATSTTSTTSTKPSSSSSSSSSQQQQQHQQQTITIYFSKSNLKKPLLPGIWQVKLIEKSILLAQCQCLIIPTIIHRSSVNKTGSDDYDNNHNEIDQDSGVVVEEEEEDQEEEESESEDEELDEQKINEDNQFKLTSIENQYKLNTNYHINSIWNKFLLSDTEIFQLKNQLQTNLNKIIINQRQRQRERGRGRRRRRRRRRLRLRQHSSIDSPVDEYQKWFDQLLMDYFLINEICFMFTKQNIINGNDEKIDSSSSSSLLLSLLNAIKFNHIKQCNNETEWSSFVADPKSDIYSKLLMDVS